MKAWILGTALATGWLISIGASAQAVIGQPAPAFTTVDGDGKSVSLSDYKGKHVVLEWVNPGCPYVQKHYNSGNMPTTQKAATAKGVTWLTVSSTAKDAGDYRAPKELVGWIQGKGGAPSATLIDESGKIGRAYGARTTPHMYLIDPQGKLLYAGAIDSKATSNPADIATATNYVNQAVGEALAGKAVSLPTTRAYGCSIKYADAG